MIAPHSSTAAPRLAFLCSSLEVGRDGVGDYTRSLAGECARAGHEVALLALHDRHLPAPVTEEEPPALRLPAAMSWAERTRRAEAFLAEFDPQWISLQFVPYGFHDKGLVWNLPRFLQPLTAGRRVQVTFHELWIGAYRGAGWKERAIGQLQRAGVLRLMRRLAPAAYGTSNDPYIGLLARGGIEAELLPMFGSIPLAANPDPDWLFAELRAAGVSFQRREELWIFSMFGALHAVWPPEPLFTHLLTAGARAGRRIVITSMGRLGAGEARWREFQAAYADRLHLVRLGERSPRAVSEVLQEADFGIATSPWELIGKSSSAAAMLEHGLPVIVNRDDANFAFSYRGEPVSPLLIKMGTDLADRLADLRRAAPQHGREDTARSFLESLAAAEGAALSPQRIHR